MKRRIQYGNTLQDDKRRNGTSADAVQENVLPEVQAHVLCPTCRRMISKSFVLQELYATDVGVETEVLLHHRTADKLQESALRGCHLCALLFADGFTQLGRSPTVADRNSYQVAWTNSRWNESLGHVRVVFPHTKLAHVPMHRLLLFKQPTPITSNLPLPNGFSISLRYPTMSSKESFDLARKWLLTCLMDHQETRGAIGTTSLPKRLLALETGDRHVLVRLCNTEELKHSVKYLTLSHCWGKANPPKLTKQTLGSLIEGLTIEDLPSTFADAVTITLELGYGYLWIDSLCILQDSCEDWYTEAKTMGDVYRNGVCNIAALSAVDCHHGLFTFRNPLKFQPCRITPTASKAIYVIPSATECGPTPHDLLNAQLAPLHTRAWAVQERALSPRTLYFGPGMMYWECLQCSASELSPNMRNLANLCSNDYRVSLKQDFEQLLRSGKQKGSPDRTWNNQWWSIVETYTSSQLSHREDRWVAISGLARSVEQISGLTLIAGLWKENLMRELPWHALSPGRRLENGSPTWSWTSIDAAIATESNVKSVMREPSAVVVSVPSTFEFHGPTTGEDSSPRHLTIRASLKRFIWDNRPRPNGTLSYCVHGLNDDPLAGEWFPDVEVLEDVETWAVQIYQNRTISRSRLESKCIVVTPTDSRRMDWYRVGVGFLYHASQYDPYFGKPETVRLI